MYAPRGGSQTSLRAKEIRDAIKKADAAFLNRAASAIALRAAEFPDFFGLDTTLVPAPRSAPLVTGGLWPGDRIAQAFLSAQLGHDVEHLLRRIRSVPKAAFNPNNRPTVAHHLASMIVDRSLSAPSRIIIVDDVVTAGTMLFSCATLLSDAYPNADVRAFALLRTMSSVLDVEERVDPCVGTITALASGRTRRAP